MNHEVFTIREKERTERAEVFKTISRIENKITTNSEDMGKINTVLPHKPNNSVSI